jgi:hypothetical protein
MRKRGSVNKKRKPQFTDPEYIVVDYRDRVFSGLSEGEAVFSEDLNEAKPLRGQLKYETLQRICYQKLSQIFI